MQPILVVEGDCGHKTDIITFVQCFQYNYYCLQCKKAVRVLIYIQSLARTTDYIQIPGYTVFVCKSALKEFYQQISGIQSQNKFQLIAALQQLMGSQLPINQIGNQPVQQTISIQPNQLQYQNQANLSQTGILTQPQPKLSATTQLPYISHQQLAKTQQYSNIRPQEMVQTGYNSQIKMQDQGQKYQQSVAENAALKKALAEQLLVTRQILAAIQRVTADNSAKQSEIANLTAMNNERNAKLAEIEAERKFMEIAMEIAGGMQNQADNNHVEKNNDEKSEHVAPETVNKREQIDKQVPTTVQGTQQVEKRPVNISKNIYNDGFLSVVMNVTGVAAEESQAECQIVVSCVNNAHVKNVQMQYQKARKQQLDVNPAFIDMKGPQQPEITQTIRISGQAQLSIKIMVKYMKLTGQWVKQWVDIPHVLQ